MGEIYITYKNSKNEVKGYHIEVTNETDKHVEGRDLVANKWKQFNKSRIVAHHETLDDAISWDICAVRRHGAGGQTPRAHPEQRPTEGPGDLGQHLLRPL